jgi:hypothetical protein
MPVLSLFFLLNMLYLAFMYIEHVPNRNSPPEILLRESYRDGNKVKKRTLANLSSLPTEVIEGLKVLLRGGVAVSSVDEAFVIERSLPHGHVAAVLGAARACGAEQWFAAAPAPLRSVIMALLVAWVVSPASKLATHRMLRRERDPLAIAPAGPRGRRTRTGLWRP